MLPRVQSHTADTDRLRMHYLEAGPEDGIPVVLVHGNLSTGRFFEHLMSGAPDALPRDRARHARLRRHRVRADRRHARPARLGRRHARARARARHRARPCTSSAGRPAARPSRPTRSDHGPVASLTLIDPVSPYGFGGVKADGTPCFEDWAGSGGGTGSPEFTQRLAAGDRSTESPASPRNVMNTLVLGARLTASRRARGDAAGRDPQVARWATTATRATPRPRGTGRASRPARAGSSTRCRGRYCNWSDIVELEPKPPMLWTHGTADIVIADGSAWELGTLGKLGAVPGWPGEEVFPPQPMVTQIRDGARALPRRRAAACRSSCSRAPATARRSTPPSAGARCSSSSLTQPPRAAQAGKIEQRHAGWHRLPRCTTIEDLLARARSRLDPRAGARGGSRSGSRRRCAHHRHPLRDAARA